MDWNDFEREIEILSGKVGEQPDVMVGVVRGGLIPARMLAKFLGVKEMFCLTVRKVGNERKVISEILDDLNGKRILLVEDILESGKSLIVAKEYLEKKGAKVKTACLYTMPWTTIVPDVFVKPITELVEFPWDG